MKIRDKFLLLFAVITVNSLFAVDVTFRVDMSQQTVPPEGVHVAGTFQGWDPGATLMTDAGNNIYIYTQSFTAGDYLEYKYINGDEWGEDESVPAACAQNNNRYLTVPAEDTVLVAVCFGSCNPCGNPADVTLQVDMSEQTVSPDGVHVAGSFQGWNPGGTEMSDQGNGLYTVTVTVSEGQTIEYKFINGNSWDGEETVPAACGIPNGVGGYNRFYEVPVGGGTTDEVCFGSCDPCGFVPTEVDITFRIDMSEQTISPEGVHIAGSFQGWDPGADEMTLVEDNIYEATFTLWAGDHHQYKFINGNTWDGEETVPAECGEDNGSGGYNRYIDVPETDSTLTAVCFSSCEPCGPPPVEVEVTFSVDMSEQTVAADGVHITGSFQGWDPAASPMIDMGDNIYEATFTMLSDEYHEYKFINGNSWDGEESVPEACGVDDGQGGFNRYINVPVNDTATELVCFSSCDSCGYIPVEVDITFRVDMSEEVISPDGIHIAGSFQGWEPEATEMTLVADNIYEATLTLLSAEYHEYKFINGTTWDVAEEVPQECGTDDGQGGYNRFITIPEVDTTLDVVCFGSCEPCTVGLVDRFAGNEALMLSIVPNPSGGLVDIYFDNPGKGEATLLIYDLLGNKVYESKRVFASGEQRIFSANLDRIAAGVYLCSVHWRGQESYSSAPVRLILK